ncbi:MAG TPA: class I SAM-dependent methyltransferase [Gaiellaceae bacterium]|nr:class I SAM-dependent methyltransferase [Gaiellaceae bacterium]
MGRIFAALYDKLSAKEERETVGPMRRELLSHARGRTLEIGAGTGPNLQHYPAGLDLVLTEPDVHMAKRMKVESVQARAEDLPFPDASFDTVVSTLALCTVDDLAASLREVRRVLKPGGSLLFMEHVRGEEGSKLERWQDRLEPVWGFCAGGCHPNRDTLAAIRDAGFELGDVERPAWKVPPLVRPLVIGFATRPAGVWPGSDPAT